MELKKNNFGEHLTVDGYGGEYKKLNSKTLVLECLENLPELLEMKKLSKSEVYSAPDNGLKDPRGWSGFVVIAESHISVHTFPARGFISADVYTCREGMKRDFIINYFKDTFGLKKIESNFILRGTEYPEANIY